MEITLSKSVQKAKKANTFLTSDFLLQNTISQQLYHDYAEAMPIIDFHNHLPPHEIAEDKKFENITEIWLKGDHYKWRAMRVMGVAEEYITGKKTDEEKFFKWAEVVPHTLMNPLFHWSQMELKNPFKVEEYLNPQSAENIYDHCSNLLKSDDFSTRNILRNFNVKMVGTTDDPCDDLSAHIALAKEGFEIKVLPSFRPDKIYNIGDKESFFAYLEELEKASGIEIKGMEDLLRAFQNRVDFFHKNGCRVSDHGLSNLPAIAKWNSDSETEFKKFLSVRNFDFSQPDLFVFHVLTELCKMYHTKNWVQQFHLGPLRNNNSRMLRQTGPDAGFDSIGDFSQGFTLSSFLNYLDNSNELAKTIIYNLNPADNELFAAMTGNFNNSNIKGKVQFGPAWWFLDQKDGMEKQLKTVANLSLLSTFVGMTTDSRSFLSYSRHEYFRRILCDMLGVGIMNGELPDDLDWVGGMVKDICYNNAQEYFGV